MRKLSDAEPGCSPAKITCSFSIFFGILSGILYAVRLILFVTIKTLQTRSPRYSQDRRTPPDGTCRKSSESGQAEVVAEREKQLAKKLAEQKARKRALVDPLQFGMSIRAEDIADYAPVFGSEMAPPSAAQIKMLEKAGICPDEVTNAGMASKLIDRVQARRDAGLTTPKQIRFLERIGFQHVGTWEFDSAKKLIDRIAVNRWRIPPGIIPEEYQPKGIA